MSPGPSPPLRIKICGHTRLADAQLSAEAGADAIGLVLFSGSKRAVSLADALKWIGDVPPRVERVAVFVDPTLDEVRAALRDGVFDSVQLHGRESPAFVAALVAEGFDGRVIKALRVRDRASLADIDHFPIRRFLFDGPEPGSGHVFAWSLAATALPLHPRAEFFLAGGLTPENVGAAIREVQPHGVDVASGVEVRPGRKDPEKLRRFIAAARAAAAVHD